jgi:hypothetical protein
MTSNVAVCVVGYNRLDYITQLVQSIERTEEKGVLPFHFFIDNDGTEKSKEVAEYLKTANITNKRVVLRRDNRGCGRNHIEAKIELFGDCEYDGIFVLEDDVIVSKNFFKILSNMYDWAVAKYNNIGIVQGYQTCLNERGWKAERLDCITNRNDAWLGYFIPRSTWDQIKKYVIYYYDNFIKDCRYIERLGKKDSKDRTIGQWIQDCYKECDKEWHEGNFKPKFTVTGVLKGSGQDTVMNVSTYFCGLERISTVVNHVKNIGIQGINCNKRVYNNLRLGEVNIDEFDEIPTIFS